MANTPMNPQPEQLPPWVKKLSERRQQVSYVLFGACAAAALAAILLFFKVLRVTDETPYGVYLALLAVTFLGVGAFQRFVVSGEVSAEENTRVSILALGGLVGFLTTFGLGLGLAWTWRTHILGGWTSWQSEEGWRIWVLLLVFIGGLVVMFLSLQLARTQTRTGTAQRRLLYGFNAALSVLFLLAILVVINVLTYLPVEPFISISKPYDWTSRSIYSLSPQSISVLKGLDRPVKVFVILRERDATFRWVRALMENCEGASSYFRAEYLSPDRHQSRVAELAQKYKNFGDQSQGLLVVYGTGANEENHFIRPSDLLEGQFNPQQSQLQAFNGESALISVLTFMAENKKRPTIYFTQGNGEPRLNEMRQGGGLGLLKQRLENRGYYDVKALQFSPDEKNKPEGFDVTVSKEVPDDAAVVVVVNPRQTMPTYALDALRDYMQKKNGKLVVMLGMVRNPESPSEMKRTGMEEFLTAYNVQVTNEVVLHDAYYDKRPPALVPAITNPDEGVQSRLPVAAAFKDIRFTLELPRAVQPAQGRPGGPSVEVLLEIPRECRPWLQSDLQRIDDQYFLELVKSGQLQSRLSPRSVPVAVAVSESTSSVPLDDVHARVPRTGQKPRLVVYGDADWVTNTYLANISGVYYDLFASSLAWLRERPSTIGIEPKKSDVFTWNEKTSALRMILYPSLLAVIAIVGLGAGVWIVRRR